MRKLVTVLSSLALLLSLTAGSVTAAPPVHDRAKPDKTLKSDNLKNPMAEKQAALKQTAQERVLKGKAKAVGKNQVVKVANGQYVELAFEGEEVCTQHEKVDTFRCNSATQAGLVPLT